MRQALRNWGARLSRRRARIALLGQLEEFRGVPARALRALAEEVEEESFSPNAFLPLEEERGDAVYVIECGAVHVFIGPESAPVPVRFGPGESLRFLTEPDSDLVSVQAIQPTQVLKVTRAGLDRAAERFPAIGKRFEEILEERARRAAIQKRFHEFFDGGEEGPAADRRYEELRDEWVKAHKPPDS